MSPRLEEPCLSYTNCAQSKWKELLFKNIEAKFPLLEFCTFTFSGFYVIHKLVTFIDFQQENAED